MASIKSDMEGAFNSFIEEQKKVDGRCTVSLHQFDGLGGSDGWYETLYHFLPLAEVPKLVLHPRGMTPLLDAAAKTVDDLGFNLNNMPENVRPGKVVVVIITDGAENASVELRCRPELLKERITRQQDQYNWQFVFLGANFDVEQAAVTYGIPVANSMCYAVSPQGITRMSKSLSENIGQYRAGNKLATDFTAQDKADQENS
jgi:hypothetical protein